jgi:hypothetical protein
METLRGKGSDLDDWRTPHSLGKLIEWKPSFSIFERVDPTPHSLGKLIEWKLGQSPEHRLHF